MDQVHFIFGEDSYGTMQELKRWKTAFISKHGEINLDEISADECDFKSIKSCLISTPFLSEKRLIIIKRIFELKNKDAHEKLIKTLAEIPDTNILLFVEFSKPDSRLALFKTLSKNANSKEFPSLSPPKIIEFIRSIGAKNNIDLNASFAQIIFNMVGANLWALEMEVKKIASFFQDKRINKEDLMSMLSDNAQENIFALTDNLSQGNSTGAINIIKKMESQSMPAGMVFSMITRQIRLLLEIKSLSEDDSMPQSLIAKKIGAHPFVVQKSAQYALRFQKNQLIRLLNILKKIDSRLKQSHIHTTSSDESHFFMQLESAILNF